MTLPLNKNTLLLVTISGYVLIWNLTTYFSLLFFWQNLKATQCMDFATTRQLYWPAIFCRNEGKTMGAQLLLSVPVPWSLTAFVSAFAILQQVLMSVASTLDAVSHSHGRGKEKAERQVRFTPQLCVFHYFAIYIFYLFLLPSSAQSCFKWGVYDFSFAA